MHQRRTLRTIDARWHHHLIIVSSSFPHYNRHHLAVGLTRLGLGSPLGSEEISQQRERTTPRSLHRPCRAFQTPGRGPQSGCRVKEPTWEGTSPKEKGRRLGWGGVSSHHGMGCCGRDEFGEEATSFPGGSPASWFRRSGKNGEQSPGSLGFLEEGAAPGAS